jgi:hypothetical protein
MMHKLGIRLQNEDNMLVSLGVEDWDSFSGNSPHIFTGSTIYGMIVNGWKPFFGVNIGYNSNTSKLQFHKYLIGLKQLDWSLMIHTDFNRKHISIPSTSDNTYKYETTVICDGRVDKDVKLSSELTIDKNPLMKEPDVRFNIGGEFRIDSLTLLKAKVSSDQSMILSLTRNFRQLIDLSLTTRVIFLNFSLK